MAGAAVADRYAQLFDDPPAMWRTIESAEATARFIQDATAGRRTVVATGG